jgi:hypothetical protein
MAEKTFLQLADEADKLVKAQLDEVEKAKVGLNLRTARVKKSERDAQEKEKQLAEWELALNRKYEEVSRMENAKFLESKANQQNERASQMLAKAEDLKTKAEAELAEAHFMKEEIAARELAVTAREKDMRERIKREVADGLLKSFSGGK